MLTNSDDTQIEILKACLVSLELSSEEISIYMELIECGSASAGILSKKISIARTTTYNHIKKLLEKGLINQSSRNGIKIFFPENPDHVINIYKRKIDDLTINMDKFKEITPKIKEKLSGKSLRPKFKLYEDIEGIRNIFADHLLYPDSVTSIFWPIQHVIDHAQPKFIRQFNIDRIRKNINVRAIFPKQALIDFRKHPYIAPGKKLKREIRIAPDNISFQLGYVIYDNKVSFLSSRKEGMGYIIESEELVETMQSQFDYMWNNLEPFNIELPEIDKFIKDNNL